MHVMRGVDAGVARSTKEVSTTAAEELHDQTMCGNILLTWMVTLSSLSPASAQATLERFASLPADTFAPGPTSGQFIAPANGRVPPFEDKQPVQGLSSVLRGWNGDFLVMSDNGFGAKNNSADYVLRVYRILPDFKTERGGSGAIKVRSFITLSDPNHQINFPIVADGEFYPNSIAGLPHQTRSPDLLNINDPHNLSGFGPLFRFPFQTIESVIPLGSDRLGVLDDNNYPFSSARVPGEPDPNEFIVTRLENPLVER